MPVGFQKGRSVVVNNPFASQQQQQQQTRTQQQPSFQANNGRRDDSRNRPKNPFQQNRNSSNSKSSFQNNQSNFQRIPNINNSRSTINTNPFSQQSVANQSNGFHSPVPIQPQFQGNQRSIGNGPQNFNQYNRPTGPTRGGFNPKTNQGRDGSQPKANFNPFAANSSGVTGSSFGHSTSGMMEEATMDLDNGYPASSTTLPVNQPIIHRTGNQQSSFGSNVAFNPFAKGSLSVGFHQPQNTFVQRAVPAVQVTQQALNAINSSLALRSETPRDLDFSSDQQLDFSATDGPDPVQQMDGADLAVDQSLIIGTEDKKLTEKRNSESSYASPFDEFSEVPPSGSPYDLIVSSSALMFSAGAVPTIPPPAAVR